jgi:hypothetical protein
VLTNLVLGQNSVNRKVIVHAEKVRTLTYSIFNSSMFISRTLWSNLRSVHLAVLRPYHPCHNRRHFSISPRLQAAEITDPFLATFKHTSIFQKLAGNPDALSALTSFAKLIQEQGTFCIERLICSFVFNLWFLGVDIMSGTPPSKLQMLRMLGNAEFREAAKRVAVEMQKAGVEINTEVCFVECLEFTSLVIDGVYRRPCKS